MTREQHTPGPWRVGNAANTIFGPPNGKPSPQTIASLAALNHRANARLVAAAPTMKEALINLIDNFAPLAGQNYFWDEARAAVAKAGELL